MPEENVDLLRREFDRCQAAGARVEAIPVELYAEDVEWDISAYPLVDLESRGRGRDELLDTFGRYLSGWRNYEAEAREFIAAGDNVIVNLSVTITGSNALTTCF